MKAGLLGPFPPFRGGISNCDSDLGVSISPLCELKSYNYIRLYPNFLFPGKVQEDASQKKFAEAARPVFDPYRPFSWKRARRAIRADGLDVLLVPWWTPVLGPFLGPFLRKLKKETGVKIVFICHNVLPHESFPLAKAITRTVLGRGDGFVAHNAQNAVLLEKWFPAVPVRKLFLPLFRQFPSTDGLTRLEARRSLGLDEDAGPVVLFFGLVRKYKGLSTLLQAFRDLWPGHPGLRLVIGGEFYEKRQKYEPELSRLVEAGKVLLHDRFIANEMVEYYFRSCDVVALPYRHATQSGIIPLAYRWGRGVVATDVGGLGEVVVDGVSGLLVPPDDPGQFARGLLRYLERQEDFEKAVPGVAERYRPEMYAESLVQFLAEICGGAGAR